MRGQGFVCVISCSIIGRVCAAAQSIGGIRLENKVYDALIIGAGVTGCAIARVLSKYALRVAVVEAASDVATGASGANSGIVHSGYDAKPGTLMAKLNVRGNALFDVWAEQLEVPLGRCGSMVLAFEPKDEAHLAELLDMGQKNGVPDLRILTGDEAREMEPALSPDVVSALYAPSSGITCPYEMTIACANNAADNGVDFYFDWRVTDIKRQGEMFCVSSGERSMTAAYVINAAGVYADAIARMVGDDSFCIQARRGEYLLMDREAGGKVYTVIFQPPSAMGKGVLVSPTVDGNLFAGPSAYDQDDREDASVLDEGIAVIKHLAQRSVPDLEWNKVITLFAGVRAVADTGDFIIKPSDKDARVLLAAGISSPGLSSAPAIAEEIEALLMAALTREGKPPQVKADWQPRRKAIGHFRIMTAQQRQRAIAENPLYARIVCRCEMVTEAEIVEAIHKAPGATTVDAVKRRTRAGMGRCQGGFCAPRVMQILSRELGVPMEAITKKGGASRMVLGKLRGDGQ